MTQGVSRTEPNAAGEAISDARRSLVGSARKVWADKLIDLTRRNNLLYYRELKLGSYELKAAAPDALLDLLSGSPVVLTRLVPAKDLQGEPETRGEDPNELTPEQLGAARRFVEIQRKADENFEERGLGTMFVAYGLATWIASDGGRNAEAPVLLCPVRLEGKEQKRALRRRGDLELNPALQYVLEHDYGVRSAGDRSVEVLADEERQRDVAAYEEVFKALEGAASHIPGFKVQRRAVIGNFSFQKLAMVKDLEAWGDAMATSDIVAALAGDNDARLSVGRDDGELDPDVFDLERPNKEFLVLDADSSQRLAIRAVLADQNVVIAGPPGTGKSQTISNLIAELVAAGKRVLFVAEKRAALDMVKQRLVRVGLGDVVLDVHGAVSKREIMEQFATVLTLIHSIGPVSDGALMSELQHRRDKLRAFAELLREAIRPIGLDLETVHGRLLRLPGEAKTSVRWRGPELDGFDSETSRSIDELLRTAGAYPSLFLGTDASLWCRAAIDTPEGAQRATDLVRELVADLSHLKMALTRVQQSGLRHPTSVQEAETLAQLLLGVNSLLERYDGALFAEDLPSLAAGLAVARWGFLSRLTAVLRPSFRRARKRVLALRRSGVAARVLADEVDEAEEARGRWRAAVAAAHVMPSRVAAATDSRDAVAAVSQKASALRALLAHGALPGDEIEELTRRVQALHRDEAHALRVAQLRHVDAEMRRRGAGPIVDELRTTPRDPGLWPTTFEYARLASARDRFLVEHPELAVFDGRSHDSIVAEFRRLDRAVLEAAVRRIRRAHAEHAVRAMNMKPDQASAVRNEAHKQKRHKTLRQLAAEALDVVTALKPCWMASPLAVSQVLLGSRAVAFDVVIFDEASQVLPEDAVTALLRGRVAVVAGDRHQLPPTPFFVAGQDDGDGDTDGAQATSGMESVLDAMKVFVPERSLLWHYRSEDERLIAFSNQEIYGSSLVTFPGVGRWAAVTHVLVPQVLADGEELSSSAEVERVVELVIDHATTRPDESLGVITMGIKHQRRILARLEQVREEHPELDEFFESEGHRERQEPFFVKNLERVQGDERDAIVLSIGYGKDRGGRLVYRFGPLLYDGGERRLNVAVTRAKRRLTLVTSFSHEDMEDGRIHSRGMRLLKQYIRYAATGGAVISNEAGTAVERNPFELDVEDALRSRGIDVIPQYGVSRYRIDLVANHPKLPGRRVLAIECDGASYHSVATVRDRDRLRQEHLERLGWRFVRIWSTDWFDRREEEIRRVVAAYEAAVADAPPPRPQRRGIAAAAPVLEQLTTDLQVRGPRPPLQPGLAIDEYDFSLLTQMVRWVRSDGRLRTDEQLLSEVAEVLGFARVGRRIREKISAAIRRTDRRRGTGYLGADPLID